MNLRHPPADPIDDDVVAGLRADLARIEALADASAAAMTDGILNNPEDVQRRIPHTRLWRARTDARDQLRATIALIEMRA